MKRIESDVALHRSLLKLVFFILALPCSIVAGEFRINEFAVGSDKRLGLIYSANTNAYYILYCGREVTSIVSPVAMALGNGNQGELIAPMPVSSNAAAFYRLREVPLAEPLDSDGDGIDDVYELRHRRFLNPLQSADGALDFDNDGRSNFEEYQAGTDPDEGTSKMRSITGSALNTVALKRDGSLWNWGLEAPYQTFPGTQISLAHPRFFTVPKPVQNGLGWTAVSARNEQTTLVLREDGSLFTFGQLLLTSAARQSLLSDHDWISATAGDRHVVALKIDLSLWVWGANDSGQLGDGTTTNRTSPVRVGTDNDWVAVAAGSSHSVALKKEGSLWAWGENSSGQLGDGTNVNRTTPVRIGVDNDWRKIAAGGLHTVALKRDGSLWTWGANGSGELGDGTNERKLSPERIGSENEWIAITAGGGLGGDGYSLALKRDGSLWAWGNNGGGQLVISGEKAAVEKAAALATDRIDCWREHGWRRCWRCIDCFPAR